MTQKWLRYRQTSSLGNLTDVKIRNPLHWIPFALHGQVVGPGELDTQLHSFQILELILPQKLTGQLICREADEVGVNPKLHVYIHWTIYSTVLKKLEVRADNFPNIFNCLVAEKVRDFQIAI